MSVQVGERWEEGRNVSNKNKKKSKDTGRREGATAGIETNQKIKWPRLMGTHTYHEIERHRVVL